MKIEKLNDQQIRCTLTRQDLADRNIKLTELAYGTDKIRELFRDMMDQALTDFGFEVDDIPLMVEAIPMSPEQIVLIITKVEAPDELDTRFSEFSHCREMEEDVSDEEDSSVELELPEEMIKLLGQIRQELADAGECPAVAVQAKKASPMCLFTFEDMEDAIDAAKAVAPAYHGISTLYRDETAGEYLLFLYQGDHSSMEFNRINRTMTAYLTKKKCTQNTEAYCKEHAKVILAERAVQTLAEI